MDFMIKIFTESWHGAVSNYTKQYYVRPPIKKFILITYKLMLTRSCGMYTVIDFTWG